MRDGRRDRRGKRKWEGEGEKKGREKSDEEGSRKTGREKEERVFEGRREGRWGKRKEK